MVRNINIADIRSEVYIGVKHGATIVADLNCKFKM